ncbi:DUF4367 domain-containing protein [Paenibacillus ginsengihumi]|uniref:DUF4367 domain-containing protein n=1 Tax=Paenibacillus ginsengihumi TaxID=431596 RepID=UPI0003784E26|nr:DUF4367 domain-containing protein [Paenibacillus ginsengihumi]
MKRREYFTDRTLTDAVREDWEATPAPPVPASEAWERIARELQSVNAKKASRRFVWKGRGMKTAAAALLVVALFAALAPSQNGHAFGWITKYFAKVQGSVTNLMVSREDAAGSSSQGPPSLRVEQPSEAAGQQLSLAEAEKITAFPILLPNYMPEGFELSYVNVQPQGRPGSSELELVYKNGSSTIHLTEMVIHNQYGGTFSFDNVDTEMKDVHIRGEKGNLLTFKDGSSMLIWRLGDYHLTLNSRLPESDAVRIAESVERLP